MAIQVCRLGRAPYEEVWRLQLELLTKRIRGEIPDTLLIVEHDAVITLGRKFPGAMQLMEQNLREWQGLPLFIVERGGEATYHGPGQLVMYPLFRLPENMGPKAFLRILESAMIKTLAEFGISAFRKENATGVWVHDSQSRERKIASLGIAARHFVSYHGLALNISTDLTQFGKINPCGFAPEIMTNMQELLAQATPGFDAVASMLTDFLCREFSQEVEHAISI